MELRQKFGMPALSFLHLATLLMTTAHARGAVCPMGIGVCSCDVTKIDCSRRNLTSVPGHVGAGFSQTELDISDNFIDNIPAGSLPPGLRKFRSLGNPLTNISAQAFQGSEDTLIDITLEMSHVNLQQLSDAMMPLTHLQTLSLGHNNISDFGNFIFPETLTHLFLDDNHLTSVPDGVSVMSVIQEIDVSSNAITELSSAVFPGALTDLYASHNLITKLPALQFTGPSKLEILVLAENPISSIEELSTMQSLVTLDLTHSRLATLPLALQSLPNLGELNLSDVTNLTCTCAEAELSGWFKDVSSRRELHITGTCEGNDVTYFLEVLAPQCAGAGPSVPIG